MVEIKKEGGAFYMSCVQWDDMLAICMEFTEYCKEGAVIKRKRETIIKNVEEPKKLKLYKTKNNKKETEREGSCVILSF